MVMHIVLCKQSLECPYANLATSEVVIIIYRRGLKIMGNKTVYFFIFFISPHPYDPSCFSRLLHMGLHNFVHILHQSYPPINIAIYMWVRFTDLRYNDQIAFLIAFKMDL